MKLFAGVGINGLDRKTVGPMNRLNPPSVDHVVLHAEAPAIFLGLPDVSLQGIVWFFVCDSGVNGGSNWVDLRIDTGLFDGRRLSRFVPGLGMRETRGIAADSGSAATGAGGDFCRAACFSSASSFDFQSCRILRSSCTTSELASRSKAWWRALAAIALLKSDQEKNVPATAQQYATEPSNNRRISEIASRRFASTCPAVPPWPFAPGTCGQYAMSPSPSRSITAPNLASIDSQCNFYCTCSAHER